jgi:hypothetical protein
VRPHEIPHDTYTNGGMSRLECRHAASCNGTNQGRAAHRSALVSCLACQSQGWRRCVCGRPSLTSAQRALQQTICPRPSTAPYAIGPSSGAYVPREAASCATCIPRGVVSRMRTALEALCTHVPAPNLAAHCGWLRRCRLQPLACLLCGSFAGSSEALERVPSYAGSLGAGRRARCIRLGRRFGGLLVQRRPVVGRSL